MLRYIERSSQLA